MNLKHVEQRLRVKQHELLSSLASTDNPTSSETLDSVQEALRRLGDGNYGKCAQCGGPIEAAQLKSAPWSLYCLAHQEEKKQARKEHSDDLTQSQSA